MALFTISPRWGFAATAIRFPGRWPGLVYPTPFGSAKSGDINSPQRGSDNPARGNAPGKWAGSIKALKGRHSESRMRIFVRLGEAPAEPMCNTRAAHRGLMCNKIPAFRGTQKRCASRADVQHARCAWVLSLVGAGGKGEKFVKSVVKIFSVLRFLCSVLFHFAIAIALSPYSTSREHDLSSSARTVSARRGFVFVTATLRRSIYSSRRRRRPLNHAGLSHPRSSFRMTGCPPPERCVNINRRRVNLNDYEFRGKKRRLTSISVVRYRIPLETLSLYLSSFPSQGGSYVASWSY